MSGHGKFYASDNPESFLVGPCDTREEAIEWFKRDYDGREPSVIGIGRDIYCEIDGYRVVEEWANGRGVDELYEDALEGWCSFKWDDPRFDDLTERLTNVFHAWLDEVGEPKSWTLIESEKDSHEA